MSDRIRTPLVELARMSFARFVTMWPLFLPTAIPLADGGTTAVVFVVFEAGADMMID